MDQDMIPKLTAIIRPAEESDLNVLCDLYYEFHEFHADHLPAYLRSLGEPSADDRMALTEKIKVIIQGSDSAILVAEDSGRVIGFAEIYLKHPDPTNPYLTPTPHAHLQSLSVTRAFRRKGIGSQLMLSAEAWVKSRGALEMRLDTWEFSAGPLDFYQKTGYCTFRRSLMKNL